MTGNTNAEVDRVFVGEYVDEAKVTANEVGPSLLKGELPKVFKRTGTVYAIAVEVDRGQLRVHSSDPSSASEEMRQVLEGHGFQWQQGSVYFGGPSVTAASVMVAVIDLTARLPWFAASVRDIRMLRIEELNDLMPGGPACRRAVGRRRVSVTCQRLCMSNDPASVE